MALTFSPFDALCLRPALYTQVEIREAWRTAVKDVHPDKRDSQRLTRWPTISHLQQAKEALINDCALMLEKFKDFPSIRILDTKTDVPLNQGFRQCSDCDMVILKADLESHLEEHGRVLCSICQCDIAQNTVAGHYLEQHNASWCGYCSAYIPLQLFDQHRRQHECPLCELSLAEGALLDHLSFAHSAPSCRECQLTDNQARHIRRGHTWIVCPLCSIHQFSDAIWDHLENVHLLIRCTFCQNSNNLALHFQENHKCQACPYCERLVAMGHPLALHLHSDHGFRPCDERDSFAPTMSPRFEEHIEASHPCCACPECEEDIVQEALDTHLLLCHDYQRCEFCGSIEHSDALDEHLASHVFQ